VTQIRIAQLAEKLDLLATVPAVQNFAESLGNLKPKADDLCAWMQRLGGVPKALHRSEMSKARKNGSLTSEHVPSFLLAFGAQGVPAQLDEAVHAHQPWFEMLSEPVPAFRARLRLAGGDCPGPPPGAEWDGFFTPERRSRAIAAGRRSVALLRPETGQSASPIGHQRVLPMGAPNPIATSAGGLLKIPFGEKIAFGLDLSKAAPRPMPFCHLFVIQEVRVEADRIFLPLVPYPGPFGAIMPSTYLPTREVTIPADTSKHALEVPSNWGALRSLMIFVTPGPLAPQICLDDRNPNTIRPERLDWLACRLTTPGFECSILRYDYLAQAASSP